MENSNIVKGVKDPLILYNIFKNVIDNTFKVDEYDNRISQDVFYYLRSVYSSCPEHQEEGALLKHINSLFKEYVFLTKKIDEFCNKKDYSWDVYPVYDNKCYNFNFAIRIKDFDIVHVRNHKKAWEYKNPFLLFSVYFGSYSPNFHVSASNLSIFSSKYSGLSLRHDFNHPHCRSSILTDLKNLTKIDIYALIHKNLSTTNFCQGRSLIENDYRNLNESYEHFEYFMFRYINYIKEYNIADRIVTTPTTDLEQEPEHLGIYTFGNNISASNIKNLIKDIKVDLRCFFVDPNNEIQIAQDFWDKLKIAIVENSKSLSFDTKVIVNRIEKNLFEKESNLSFNVVKSINSDYENQQSIIDTYSKNLSFYHDGKKVNFEYYISNESKTYFAEDFYFKDIFKESFKNLITKIINQ